MTLPGLTERQTRLGYRMTYFRDSGGFYKLQVKDRSGTVVVAAQGWNFSQTLQIVINKTTAYIGGPFVGDASLDRMIREIDMLDLGL